MCNDAAELSHAVEGRAENCGRQSTEHAAVVVGHDTEDQLTIEIGYRDHWWIRIQRLVLLAGEIERLVCNLGGKITGLVFRRARVRTRKGRSGGRMIFTRKRIGECSLQVYGDDRELFAIQRNLKVG